MPRRSGETRGALRRNSTGKNEIFKNVMTNTKMTVSAWEEELKAKRGRQRAKSGVWNPKLGRREYSGRER